MFERFVGCRLSYVELYDGCRVSHVVGPRDSVVRIGVRTAVRLNLLNLLTYKHGSNIPVDKYKGRDDGARGTRAPRQQCVLRVPNKKYVGEDRIRRRTTP